jgi:hypothetical protein
LPNFPRGANGDVAHLLHGDEPVSALAINRSLWAGVLCNFFNLRFSPNFSTFAFSSITAIKSLFASNIGDQLNDKIS